MATTHISVLKLPPEVRDLINRLRAGEEIVIDSENESVAVIRAAKPAAAQMDSSISATIARIEARDIERGYPLRMGADFADDLEEIVNNRKPRDTSAWD
jgi:antitoxin (DNA-binding transcriptional repressor) of toxin-antitoxin stability system